MRPTTSVNDAGEDQQLGSPPHLPSRTELREPIFHSFGGTHVHGGRHRRVLLPMPALRGHDLRIPRLLVTHLCPPPRRIVGFGSTWPHVCHQMATCLPRHAPLGPRRVSLGPHRVPVDLRRRIHYLLQHFFLASMVHGCHPAKVFSDLERSVPYILQP
jgi:hypothetical protein